METKHEPVNSPHAAAVTSRKEQGWTNRPGFFGWDLGQFCTFPPAAVGLGWLGGHDCVGVGVWRINFTSPAS